MKKTIKMASHVVAFAMAITLLAGVFAAIATPVYTSAAARGTFYIQARGSNLFLDVRGGNVNNGTRVWLWYHNRSIAQQWRFTRNANGTYTIQAVHSGRVLEVRDSSRVNGGVVQQWDNVGIATQRWHLRGVGGGYYEIINANSGLALDVTGGRFEQGNYLQQFNRNGTRSQQFRLVPVGGGSGARQLGHYRITARTGLNVRQQANASSAILTAVPYGTTVNVTQVSGNWGVITFNNRTGWISLDHAVFVGGGGGGGGGQTTGGNFTPRFTAPPHNVNPWIPRSAQNPFAISGGNCTWYAWGRATEILGRNPQLNRGHARYWFGNGGPFRGTESFQRGQTPRVGAIAVWGPGASRNHNYGHVSVVESVDGRGYVRLSGSNWGGQRFYTTNYINVRNHRGDFLGFIYLR